MALVIEDPPGVENMKRTNPTSGLYPLEFQDQVYLTEVLEEHQPITGWENCKKYTVSDVQGNKLFSATETDPDLFNKVVAKSRRAFEISVINVDNQQVMKFVRHYQNHGISFNIGGFDFRGEKVLICDSNGTTIGTAHQISKDPFSPPDLKIKNEREEDKVLMKSPVNPFLSIAEYLFEMEWYGSQQPLGTVKRIYPGNFFQSWLRHPRRYDIKCYGPENKLSGNDGRNSRGKSGNGGGRRSDHDGREERIRRELAEKREKKRKEWENADLKKSLQERLDMFHAYLWKVLKASGSPEKLDSKAIVIKAERLDVKEKAPLLLTWELFDRNVMKEIKMCRKLLTAFMHRNVRAQQYLLGGVEQLVSDEKYRESLMPKVAYILKSLYDRDIVDEETLLEWGKKPSRKYVSLEMSKKILEKAAPLLQWLEEAEKESSEDEEEGMMFEEKGRGHVKLDEKPTESEVPEDVTEGKGEKDAKDGETIGEERCKETGGKSVKEEVQGEKEKKVGWKKGPRVTERN